MTFKDFLRTCRVDDDIEGDFIQDARRDRHLPDVQTREELLSYIRRRTGEDEDVEEAASLAWDSYENAKAAA